MLVSSDELRCRRARHILKSTIAGLERFELSLCITVTLNVRVRVETVLRHAVCSTYFEGAADSDKVEERALQRREEIAFSAFHSIPQLKDMSATEALGKVTGWYCTVA